MPFGNYLELTEPGIIRALAHPARTLILNHLYEAGPSTATECAEVVGRSPSACSYHLRQLAAYGFVEEVDSGYGVPKEVQDRPEILDALRPLTRRWVEDNQTVIAEYMEKERSLSPAWRKAATFQQMTLEISPDELIRISEQVQELLKPYADRDRPEGSDRVHALFIALPRPPQKERRASPPKRAKARRKGTSAPKAPGPAKAAKRKAAARGTSGKSHG
jgi:DNA-binding transcriptional ArsR family regulator